MTGADMTGRFLGGVLSCILVLLAFALAALPARAGADPARPSPRGVVAIGGASVVLVAANNRIYAFVDRLEDNAPVDNAVLSLALADGAGLKLSELKPQRVAEGLFVAPFSHAGRHQDAFLVSLASPAGSGAATAYIAYAGAAAADVAPAGTELSGKAAIALVAGAIGAAVATSVILLTRRRRRAAAAPDRSALVV